MDMIFLLFWTTNWIAICANSSPWGKRRHGIIIRGYQSSSFGYQTDMWESASSMSLVDEMIAMFLWLCWHKQSLGIVAD